MTNSYYLNQLIHHITNPEEMDAPSFEQSVVRMVAFAGIEKAKGNYHTWTGANEMVAIAQEILDDHS